MLKNENKKKLLFAEEMFVRSNKKRQEIKPLQTKYQDNSWRNNKMG